MFFVSAYRICRFNKGHLPPRIYQNRPTIATVKEYALLLGGGKSKGKCKKVMVVVEEQHNNGMLYTTKFYCQVIGSGVTIQRS